MENARHQRNDEISLEEEEIIVVDELTTVGARYKQPHDDNELRYSSTKAD